MTIIKQIRVLAALVIALLASTAGIISKAAPPTASSEVLARIALLSDPHLNLETNGDQATYAEHLKKTIAQVNAARVDFILIAGDLTQSGRPEQFADFKTNLAAFHAPVWYAPGNHDVGNKFNSGKEGQTTVKRVKAYEKAVGPSWFSTNCAGVRIIGVNSSILGSGFEQETQMWSLLEHELRKPVSEPTVLFMHYPLFLKDLNEPGGDYWDVEPAPRTRLYQLLKQGGVKIVLTGHLHRPLVNRRDGILFVTTPPISFGLPRGKQPEGWTLVTILKNGEATSEIKTLDTPPVGH